MMTENTIISAKPRFSQLQNDGKVEICGLHISRCWLHDISPRTMNDENRDSSRSWRDGEWPFRVQPGVALWPRTARIARIFLRYVMVCHAILSLKGDIDNCWTHIIWACVEIGYLSLTACWIQLDLSLGSRVRASTADQRRPNNPTKIPIQIHIRS